MRLSPGTRLGPYEILAVLGAGGMGEAYRARDPRLGRDVAIKVLPQHLSTDPNALSRFEREVRAVAALSHPNILAIFDVGSADGVSYAVTELLEGETLRARLKQGALPWPMASEIGSAIAEGVAAAHSKGIIHRDLKPENIFLTRDGRAKVLDFGLARLTSEDPDATSAPTETEPGVVMGTVGYMSPEQVKGKAAGAPSDVFSLGCVLYEMIAGRRAFARETAAQTMAAILEQPPAALVGIAGVPKDADRLIAHCLEKDPAHRMQSAHDLAFALRTLSSGSGRYRAGRAPSQRRAIALAAVAAVALAISGAAAVYWSTVRDGSTESIAILPFVNTSGNADVDYLSDGITESLINGLSQAPNLSVVSRNAAFRYKGRDTDAQAAGRALKVHAVLTGRVSQRGDALSINTELIDVRNNRQLWGEQYNRKLSDIQAVQEEISIEISDKLRLRLTGEDKRRLTKRYTQNTEAYQLYLRGRYYWNKKTPDGFNRGIEEFQKAIELDANYAPAYAGMAALYNNLANYNFGLIPPREAWAKAKAAATRASQIDDTLASAHASLALVAYQWEWDWPTAEKEFKRAIELDSGSSSTYEPSPASNYHWYSHFLMCLKRVDESYRAGRHAMELDPTDLAINAHQGWHYLWIHEFDTAIEPLKKAIELDPSFVVTQWYLGLAYEQQKKFDAAVAQFQSCVRMTAGRPSMVALLGHAYAVAGRTGYAQNVLRQLDAEAKTRYVPPYPIAVIYAGLGQNDDAFAWLEKAYDGRDSWMAYLAIDPRMDVLHADPRFHALLQRMKLTL
jgi:eukaryotic-like serine/threonine-protein kinase